MFNETAWLESAARALSALLPDTGFTITGATVDREPGVQKTRMGRYLRCPGWFQATLDVEVREEDTVTCYSKRLVWDRRTGCPLSPEELGAAMAGMVVAAIVEEVADGEEEQQSRR